MRRPCLPREKRSAVSEQFADLDRTMDHRSLAAFTVSEKEEPLRVLRDLHQVGPRKRAHHVPWRTTCLRARTRAKVWVRELTRLSAAR